MTKIIEKSKKADVHLHIQEAFKIIEDHLPESYVNEVAAKLEPNSKITADMIRNIRTKKTKGEKPTHLKVVNALVEVAIEYKKLKEKLAINILQ